MRIFSKKLILDSEYPVDLLKNRMENFITKKWSGIGYIDGNSFYIKPEFRGRFFQVQAKGVFIKKSSFTGVSVVFSIDKTIEWLLLLMTLLGPVFFVWLKLTNSFFLGSAPTKNIDFLLLFFPVIIGFVSYMTFYSQYDFLKSIIKSVITKRSV